ncbi:hypothetical protein [Acidihalobacter prosperus]|uniref:CRISPR-associated RAMP protein n=1 Tax=Acidihalobacter prosperus TaxID=160660 RepID=A0A1A6C331_9GAMM|nr:hypothetical protein [Acidihalobacter prosperus]OBS08964.1 hypothetical protein Thpro_022081 [Acidihalobacter prosperus]
MHTFTLEGHLFARQPIAVAPPDPYGSSEESPSRLPRAGYSLASSRYIPASTLRNAIRHALVSVVAGVSAEHGKPIDLAPLLVLSKGYIKMKKKKKGEKKTPENTKKTSTRLQQEREIREKNPILSMLGIWGVPAELSVGNAFPKMDSGEDAWGVAPKEVRKPLETDLESLLVPDDMSLYTQLLDESADSEKDSTGLMHLGRGWEEIQAGSHCDWKLSLHRPDEFKVGALLAAFRHLSAEPVIGGHRALGRGLFGVDLEASVIQHRLLEAPQKQPAGRVKVERGVFEIDGDLARYLEAFDASAKAGFPGIDLTLAPSASEAA